MNFLLIVSPKESWQRIYIVRDAPSSWEAEQMMWTEKGYNSGEPVHIYPCGDVTVASAAAKEVFTYNAAKVEASRETVRYND
jgi:hypothetical protein